MLRFARNRMRALARRMGYGFVPQHPDGTPRDFDDATRALVERVRPYTMTSPERIQALQEAVRYIERHAIPGDVVECGVWRGGSMMAAALTLLEGEQKPTRHLHLLDTFEGMTDPTDEDRSMHGESAKELLAGTDRDYWLWCRSPLEEVKKTMVATGYPEERIHYVKGPVEETLPAAAPEAIALLRLDTDWYESTRQELIHLWPRLARGGVMILDDYGHWEGARKAVDEYFEASGDRVLLQRIDESGRLIVKLDD